MMSASFISPRRVAAILADADAEARTILDGDARPPGTLVRALNLAFRIRRDLGISDPAEFYHRLRGRGYPALQQLAFVALSTLAGEKQPKPKQKESKNAT